MNETRWIHTGAPRFTSAGEHEVVPDDLGAQLRAGMTTCAICGAQVARVQVAADEQVDHPPHYGGADNPYEAIRVIEEWQLGFCLGNAIKYIARAGRKGDMLTDLRKARWYLDREISRRLEPALTDEQSP